MAPYQRNFNIDPPGLSRYYDYTSVVNAKSKKTFAKLDLQISAELPNTKLLFFAKITFLREHSLAARQRSCNIDPPGLSRYYDYTSIVQTKCHKTFAKLDLQISAELPNTKLLFFAKITFLREHSLVPRQRTFNIDPPGLSRYYYFELITNAKCQKTFAKLALQISAELPNTKLHFIAKIPFSSQHSLAPRQRSCNIDPPRLSRYYDYTSIVQTKCQKTYAKLDLQTSAELPNTKLLFFAKNTFLREHSLAPRQRSCNIDSPGLSRYYYFASTVQTKCQKTFAKLDLQISAELPNPKPLFFAKITFLREHSLAPRQRSCNIDPPGLSRYYDYTSIVQTKCQKTFAKLDLQISAELPNPKPLFFAKITFLREHSLVPRQRSCNIDSPGLSRYYYYALITNAKCQNTFAKLDLQISAELPNPKLHFIAKIPFSSQHSLVPRQRSCNIDPPGLSRYYDYTSIVQTKRQKTFAKLDLQISAELPNPKLLFFAKITFLREHSSAPRQRSCNIDPPGLSQYYYYASTVQTKCQNTFAKLDLQTSAELPNPKPLFFAKITFLREHSLVPRQRSCNIDPPGLSRYYHYALITNAKCHKTFAKLDLQISAELPNPKLLFFAKITFLREHSLAPRQRSCNIDPPGLSRYYDYTSIVQTKCQNTFAKLDLQISAELPNPKLLFFAKITFLREHSLVPRQRSCNIDPPGLSRYYDYTSIVQTKCQNTFAKLDLQTSAELPNPKLMFFAKITFLREHSLAPRQRSCNIDPPGLSRYYYYASTVQTKCQKTFAKLDLQISAELPNTKLHFIAKIPFSSQHSLAARQRSCNIDPPGLSRYYDYTSIVQTKCHKTYANFDLQISAELPNPKPLFFAKITFLREHSLAPRQRSCNIDPPGLSRYYYFASTVQTKCQKHLPNSISKYQQNCQTQNCCFSQKSRFYVNIVWPLANGVVTSTPRV